MPSVLPSSFDDAEHSGAGFDAIAKFATHRFDSPHVIAPERSATGDQLPQTEYAARTTQPNRVAQSRLDEVTPADESESFAGRPSRAAEGPSNVSSKLSSNGAAGTELDPQAIRDAHADDLIGFLQQWSEDLDQRSARLHADIATQERRERAFRLWMQNRRAEWEQKITECEQIQRQAEAAARRIAFSG